MCGIQSTLRWTTGDELLSTPLSLRAHSGLALGAANCIWNSPSAVPVDDADDDGAGAQSLDFFLGLYGGISDIRGGDGLTTAVAGLFFLYGGISGICIGGVDIRIDEPDVSAAAEDVDATVVWIAVGGPEGPLILPPPTDDVVVDDADVCPGL